MSELKKSKNNRIFAFATYFQVVLLMIQLLLYKIIGHNSTVHTAIVFFAAIPMVICAIKWIQGKRVRIIIVYLFVAFVYFFNIVMFPENRSVIGNDVFSLFFICIPCFINISLIGNEQEHITIMRNLSIIVFIVGEFYLLLYLKSSATSESTYSMAYSYYMLLPALISMYLFISEGKKAYFIISIVAFFSMILIGSRGAVVTCAIYYMVVILMHVRSGIIKVLSIGGIAVIALRFNQIIAIIGAILPGYGLTSRTISLAGKGELLSHDSGRSIIRSAGIEMIKSHPIVGSGIGADYRVLGNYSHNLFLDVFIHFGIVFGGLIIVVLIVYIIYSFLNGTNKLLYLLFFCYGFIPLMVSGTYLSSVSFWIFLGYICKHRIVVKKTVKYV